MDPCLFLKKNLICFVYVDDIILAGPDGDELEKEIINLGVEKEEYQHKFELRNEGEVGDFLGIRIKNTGEKQFQFSQSGLIDKVIKETEMEDSNSVLSPTATGALGKDEGGDPFDEKWDYPSVIGMLLYLSGNSRPDTAFAVNQCARFTHAPKKSHATAVKRIIRYLKGSTDQGLILKPKCNYKIDCYVDTDYAGLWSTCEDK